MIIAIPVLEKNVEEKVCISFGRAPFYYIYDSKSKKGTFFENEAANAPGGAGIKSSQFLVNKGVNVLITKSCGENAADVLKNAKIEIFKAIEGNLKDNVSAYLNNTLGKLVEIHQGFHGK